MNLKDVTLTSPLEDWKQKVDYNGSTVAHMKALEDHLSISLDRIDLLSLVNNSHITVAEIILKEEFKVAGSVENLRSKWFTKELLMLGSNHRTIFQQLVSLGYDPDLTSEDSPVDEEVLSLCSNAGISNAYMYVATTKQVLTPTTLSDKLYLLPNQDGLGQTPIHIAAARGMWIPRTYKKFLTVKDADGVTPTHALAYTSERIVEYTVALFSQKDNEGNTPASILANWIKQAPSKPSFLKTATATGTVAHILASRGLLDKETRVSIVVLKDKKGRTVKSLQR